MRTCEHCHRDGVDSRNHHCHGESEIDHQRLGVMAGVFLAFEKVHDDKILMKWFLNSISSVAIEVRRLGSPQLSGMRPRKGTASAYGCGEKRQRTAALQDLAEGAACVPSRQRLGVRLSSAALTSVRWQSDSQ